MRHVRQFLFRWFILTATLIFMILPNRCFAGFFNVAKVNNGPRGIVAASSALNPPPPPPPVIDPPDILVLVSPNVGPGSVEAVANMDLSATPPKEFENAIKSVTNPSDSPQVAFVVDTPEQALMLEKTTAEIFRWGMTMMSDKGGGGRSGRTAMSYESFEIESLFAENTAATNVSTDAQVPEVPRKFKKKIGLDKRAADFILGVSLAAYAVMSRDGKLVLGWAVNRAIRRSNDLFAEVYEERARLLKTPPSPERDRKAKVLLTLLTNKDVRKVKDWLQLVGSKIKAFKDIEKDDGSEDTI